MVGLLRRILSSGYIIVAIGTVGFAAVLSLQFIVEFSRREAFATLQNAQNSQRTLNLLAKEIWQLRYWDNSPNFDYEALQKERIDIQRRITTLQKSVVQHAARLRQLSDVQVLNAQTDEYIDASSASHELWKKTGRWYTGTERQGLIGAIEVLDRTYQATPATAPLHSTLKEIQFEQYHILARGLVGARSMPDGVMLSDAARRALTQIDNVSLPADLMSQAKRALVALMNKEYITQQLELSASIARRNKLFDELENNLRALALDLEHTGLAAQEGFETARRQSLVIVTSGSIGLCTLFVLFGITSTRSTRRQAALLRLSERRFKDFASASSDSLVEIGPDFKIIETYRINEGNSPVDRRLAPGQPFFETPDRMLQSGLYHILKREEAFRDYEAQLPTPHGTYAYRRVNGVPFYDVNHKFAGFRLSIVNTTDQKKLELEVDSRRALYEQLVEQIPGAVFVVAIPKDGPSSLEYVSPSFTKLLGYSLEEANEKIRARGTIITGNDINRARELRARSGDGSVEMKTTVQHKDGTLIPVVYSSRRIRPGAHGEDRNLVMFLDISELEAAERAVSERERQLTSILSNIGSAYFFSVVMGDGKIEPQFCSAGVEAVLGYTPQEWTDLFLEGETGFARTAPPEDRPRIEAMFNEMKEGKDPYQWEFQAINRRLRKDGTIISCMTRGRHIRLPDGRLLQEGMVIDVTADMRRQEELIRLKAAVDGASDCIAVWRRLDKVPGGRRELIYANKAAQEMIARTTFDFDKDKAWGATEGDPEPDLDMVGIDRVVDLHGRWQGQKAVLTGPGRPVILDITLTRIDENMELHVTRDITAIKELEQANERARAELQDVVAALDFAGEGISITENTKIKFANKSFAKIVEVDNPSSVLGKAFVDLIVEADPPSSETQAAMRVAMAAGKSYASEATVTLPSGSQKILRWSTAALGDGRWINISRDVTEARSLELRRTGLDRSVAELASRRDISRMPPREVYELILREIADTMDVKRCGIWRFTTDKAALQSVLAVENGRINSEFSTLEKAGREPYFDELFTLRAIVANDVQTHPATMCMATSHFAPLGITSTLDVPILWQGALWGIICIEHVGRARTWDAAEVTYATYMADFIVMTLERLARDEAQARIEYLYQENVSILSALDSTQERIIIEDAGGYIRYVNQSVADAWGNGSKTDLMGRPFMSAFPLLTPYRRSMEAEVMASISAAGSWQGELLISRPSGEPAYVDVRVMELPDNGLLYTAEDITEQRKHEQREQQLKTQLIEAQKMESIGRLAGGVAHDFNNIIAAVRAFASLVGGEVQAGTKAKTYTERIINTCDRAADLVRQILLFSRASRAELKATNIGEVIEEITAYLRASIPASISVDVTPPERDAVVLGNAGQLVQVLMNLGLNARDAIGEKPGRIQLYTEERTLSDQEVGEYKPGLSMTKTSRTDGVLVHQYVVGAPLSDQPYLCVTVRDNGPGMSGITVERMFEPFFTTKEKTRGTGLGLPVVAAVVAAHSGFVVVTTQQGRGCRFNVYLPLSRHVALEANDNAGQDAERLRGNERVLLVDDESDLADATALLLRKYGYDVAPIYFPRDALRIFEEDPNAWDVIITDQVMPSMKGLELMSHVRKLREDIPVILCTGYSDHATERNAKGLGADAFFTKPVLPENLALAIRQVCQAKETA
jgi:PAS domain S-box-containing protein